MVTFGFAAAAARGAIRVPWSLCALGALGAFGALGYYIYIHWGYIRTMEKRIYYLGFRV